TAAATSAARTRDTMTGLPGPMSLFRSAAVRWVEPPGPAGACHRAGQRPDPGGRPDGKLRENHQGPVSDKADRGLSWPLIHPTARNPSRCCDEMRPPSPCACPSDMLPAVRTQGSETMKRPIPVLIALAMTAVALPNDASAESIAVFTKNTTNPFSKAIRTG